MKEIPIWEKFTSTEETRETATDYFNKSQGDDDL